MIFVDAADRWWRAQSSADDRHLGHRGGNGVIAQVVVHHLAGEEFLVGRQVEVSVATQRGEDHFLFANDGLVHEHMVQHAAKGIARVRQGQRVHR